MTYTVYRFGGRRVKVGNLVRHRETQKVGLVVDVVVIGFIVRNIKVLLTSGDIFNFYPPRMEIISESR